MKTGIDALLIHTVDIKYSKFVKVAVSFITEKIFNQPQSHQVEKIYWQELKECNNNCLLSYLVMDNIGPNRSIWPVEIFI